MENPVTNKMIEKIQGWNFEEIKAKVQKEFDAGFEVARNKRLILQDYIKDYHVQGDKMKEGETIKSKSLYTYRNLFISALYKNRPNVVVEGRKQGDSEYADTWNNLLHFDYDELDEDIVTFDKITDMCDCGIYLAVSEGWDKTTESPKKRLYSPMCWIPDPFFDVVKGFSFHGFQLVLTEGEINELYGNKELMLTNKELEEIRKKCGNAHTYEVGLDNRAIGGGFGFDWSTIPSNLKEYSVYRHFTKFNGRWYLTERANDRTLLIRCEEIEAVRSEEKKDPTKIPCPVVHSWLFPKRGDPFGLCVGDLARDNQVSEEQIMNLLVNKVHEETFSGMTVFNEDVVDGEELAHRVLGKRKFVPSKGNLENRKILENIQTQTSSSNDGYNLKNMIDQKSTKEIGFDEQSIGVYSKTITATQSELLQGNQNVRLSTIFKIFLRGEKRYWDILRYREYQKNFKMRSKKNITLNQGFGKIAFTILGKDLDTKRDLHLAFTTVTDKKEKDEANKAAIMASYQPLMEQASSFGKIQLTRQFATIMGLDKELINMVYDYPPEYHKAMDDVELLNNGQEVDEIRDMSEDHNIYIQIYQQALDGPAKEKAIAARQRALVLSGQNLMNQQAMAPNGQSASTNQLVSNYISQQNQANNQPTVLGPTVGNDVPTAE